MEDITLTKRFTDTNENWEWQQHLESVVESANDMVISIDAAKRIKSWNSAAQLLTGYPLYSVSGQPIEPMLVHPGGREDLVEQFLDGKMIGQYVEIGIRTKDGRQMPISWGSALMKNERGDKIGLVLVGRDLTERRELEQEMLQQAKMTSLGVMAGGVAHELKNPLAVIGGAAQLLEKRYPDEFVQKSVKMIRDAVSRGSKVVDNLLHFARREPHTSFELLSVNRIVEDALSLLENQINLQQVKINKKLDDDLSLILGNANQLQQVIMNLILNAQAAMPKGGELTLETKSMNDQVMIKCSDTGEGISADDLEKIFDPFYTTRAPGKGTGLGLSISYQIVQQHDGVIEVYSAGKNKGSIFTIKLPIYSAEREHKDGKTW
ncbi:PAS domain S-box protein [Candidatus Poribacteria bacterium]|nr:PAS domain S-box protein [Candidatus Poribacteria bacterium]